MDPEKTTGNTAPVQEEAPQTTDAVKKSRKALWGKILGIIAAVIVLLLLFRDPVIRLVTCKVGSFLTGTEVKLASFSSSLTGKVHLKGFAVGNPEGYTPNNAIEFKEIYVSLNIASLLTDMIKVEQITVTGMNVNFESNLTESNLGRIQANLNKIAGSRKSAEEPAEQNAEEAGEKKAKNVLIVKLDASDNFISFTSSTISQTLSIPLPPAHLSDIGGKPLSETLSDLLGIIITSAGNAAGNIGGAVGSAVSQTGAAVSDSVNQAGTAVAESAKDLGKGLSKEGSKFFKSIKKTFK